jgi:hypothetical protein
MDDHGYHEDIDMRRNQSQRQHLMDTHASHRDRNDNLLDIYDIPMDPTTVMVLMKMVMMM